MEVSDGWVGWWKGVGLGVLGLELVGENQIGFSKQALVLWDLVLGNVEFAVVAHDGVEDLLLRQHTVSSVVMLDAPQKKLPGFVPALNLMSLPILPTARTASALGT